MNKIALRVVIVALVLTGCTEKQPNQNTKTHTQSETASKTVKRPYDYSPRIAYDQNGKAIVTIQNYQRAETHYFIKGRVDAGMFGKVFIMDKPTTADNQKVVRANPDVLFCYAVLDLTEPATITLPENKGRFMEIRIFNEDHYLKVLDYEPGAYTLTRENMNTRYAHVAVRILADPNNPEDMKIANQLQRDVKLDQNSPGTFEIPDWDMASLEKVRKGLQIASSTLTTSEGAFGDLGEAEDRVHLAGTALGWGGAPERAAKYLMVTPEKNDGQTPYTLRVKDDVPVDGFWSVTVYNKEGYFEKNELDAYSINNVIAKRDADGFITIRFGGDPKADNYLPIVDGWNYSVRLYRARKELLDGTYVFPEARVVP
ncbi:DUF1214 domain-containing protein [Sediminicola luteus]|uniref:Carboxylesterase n=1 Tax=Sediminicola luteus TaxID=319238 RepID=A0A2A4G4L5_9FLAO|nr:DUF1214 domain-containing protein [Sediminicola luteus]PCE62675.1 hypothetical protein B7P33_18770 [Sediminicola luteus]